MEPLPPTPGCEDVGGHDETLINKLRSGLELLTPVLLTMWKTVYRPGPQQLNIHPYGSSCPSKARVGKINI